MTGICHYARMGGKVIPLRRSPERELAKLRAAVGVTSPARQQRQRRLWRQRWWFRRHWRSIAVALVIAGVGGYWISDVNLRSVSTGVRHMLAAPNCDAARAVGLAPARRGEPGYWPKHDADDDGVACEPIPAWKQRR